MSVFPVFAQGGGHGEGGMHHGMWPGSLETITVTGKAIVDTNFFMPMYYLDCECGNDRLILSRNEANIL